MQSIIQSSPFSVLVHCTCLSYLKHSVQFMEVCIKSGVLNKEDLQNMQCCRSLGPKEEEEKKI